MVLYKPHLSSPNWKSGKGWRLHFRDNNLIPTVIMRKADKKTCDSCEKYKMSLTEQQKPKLGWGQGLTLTTQHQDWKWKSTKWKHFWFSVKGFRFLTGNTSFHLRLQCVQKQNKWRCKPPNIKLFLKWYHFPSLQSFLQKSILSYRATAVFSIPQGTKHSTQDPLKRHLCFYISWF